MRSMFRRILKSRKRRILAASGTLGLCASLAFAAWLSQGTGAGQGKIGSSLASFTVSAGATPNSELMPGTDSAGSFHVDNTTGAPMHIVSAGDGGGDRVIVSGGNGCTVQMLNGAVLVNALSGLNIALPTG